MNNPGYQLSFNTLHLVIPVTRLQQTGFSCPPGQRWISTGNSPVSFEKQIYFITCLPCRL